MVTVDRVWSWVEPGGLPQVDQGSLEKGVSAWLALWEGRAGDGGGYVEPKKKVPRVKFEGQRLKIVNELIVRTVASRINNKNGEWERDQQFTTKFVNMLPFLFYVVSGVRLGLKVPEE